MFHSLFGCFRRRCIRFPGFVAQSCCNPGCCCRAASASESESTSCQSANCKYCIICQNQAVQPAQTPCRLPAGCGCTGGGGFPPPPPPPPFPPQRPCGCRG